jgi:N6-adenosine-specific RNA methylase IME4
MVKIFPPYSVLYVDIPWAYTNVKTGGSHTSGSRAKYRTLSLSELRTLPIPELCRSNAVIAMWATVPFGGDPYDLLKAWGFTFKTAFFWIKTGRLGMGHYFRGQVEPLLFATRGKVAPFRLNTQRNYKELPTIAHSTKPEWFRTLVEDATFDLPGKRLELFARERAPGWDATGLELDGFDIRNLRKLLDDAHRISHGQTGFESAPRVPE